MPDLDRERERLEVAIVLSRYRCVECDSAAVSLDYAPALGWVPVITHHDVGTGSCPCTHGGTAAMRATWDLLDAMVAAVAVSDYAEPVWHRRERVTA